MSCGLKWFLNKCDKRKKAGTGLYRKAKQTLSTRVRKKLMERSSWFKGKKKEEGKDLFKKGTYRDGNSRQSQDQNKGKTDGGNKVKSVIFLPNTA